MRIKLQQDQIAQIVQPRLNYNGEGLILADSLNPAAFVEVKVGFYCFCHLLILVGKNYKYWFTAEKSFDETQTQLSCPIVFYWTL